MITQATRLQEPQDLTAFNAKVVQIARVSRQQHTTPDHTAPPPHEWRRRSGSRSRLARRGPPHGRPQLDRLVKRRSARPGRVGGRGDGSGLGAAANS